MNDARTPLTFNLIFQMETVITSWGRTTRTGTRQETRPPPVVDQKTRIIFNDNLRAARFSVHRVYVRKKKKRVFSNIYFVLPETKSYGRSPILENGFYK